MLVLGLFFLSLPHPLSMLQKPDTTSVQLHSGSHRSTKMVSVISLWVPGPCTQPPPQLPACMSQPSSTRLGGSASQPCFFVGLPSSEKSTATPPVRQALNSGVIWNTFSSPYPSSSHPAPRLTGMCCPNPVHHGNRNFPTGLPKPTCASSNDYSRDQPVSDHRRYSGRSQARFPHSQDVHSSVLASRALPARPCLSL